MNIKRVYNTSVEKVMENFHSGVGVFSLNNFIKTVTFAMSDATAHRVIDNVFLRLALQLSC